MKTFYCVITHLHDVSSNPNYILLKEACESLGIEFVPVKTPSGGYVFSEVPELGEGGIYVLNIQNECFEYAFALMKKNPHLKTLYGSDSSLSPNWRELINDDAGNVPMIPTIYGLPEKLNDELIEKIESKLGGFPVILKQSGGSHGTGIMMIDSVLSLKTLYSHIVSGRRQDFVFKQFVKNARNYRVIVLNNEVISSILYPQLDDDIRSNAINDLHPVQAELKPEWAEAALGAVREKGVAFGGVDLLVSEDDYPFVAEVNTPCNLSRAQNLTGDPIATKIVSYLCI